MLAAIAAALEVALRDEPAASAAHAAVVRRTRGRVRRAAAAQPSPVPVRGPRSALAAGGPPLVRRRAPDRVSRTASTSPASPPPSCSATCAMPFRRASAWPSSRAAQRFVIYNDPNHTPGEFIFIPLLFVVGLARRLRAARAVRAGRSSGRTRDPRRAGARGGRPRRRGRGARPDRARAPRRRRPCGQRHGAPGRRRPAQAPRERSTRTGKPSRASSRPAARRLTEMRRLLGAMRSDGRGRGTRAPAGPRQPRLAARRRRPRRAPDPAARRRRALPAPAGDRPLRLSDRAGGPDQRAQARAREPGGRDHQLRARRAADRGARQRRGRLDERRPGPRARRRPRARQDLRWRDDAQAPRPRGGFVLSARLPLGGDGR